MFRLSLRFCRGRVLMRFIGSRVLPNRVAQQVLYMYRSKCRCRMISFLFFPFSTYSVSCTDELDGVEGRCCTTTHE